MLQDDSSELDPLTRLERMRERMRREHEALTRLFERLENLRKDKP